MIPQQRPALARWEWQDGNQRDNKHHPLPRSKCKTEGGFSSFLWHHPPPSPILSTNDHYHPSVASNMRRGLVLSTPSHCHSVASNMSGGACLTHCQPPPPLCCLKCEEGLVLSTTCHHCPSIASN